SRSIRRGEKPLPFRKLKTILKSYDCKFEHVKAQCKMKITRIINSKRTFGKSLTKELKTYTPYAEEGREVRADGINKIRAELQLDEEHGVDSAAFYDKAPFAIDDFIVEYRITLRQLARL